ncbi:hypothetical protein [Vibrio comitans]|uniref:Uncharacterized protein n=1 Tax=Vibrio comitans NBRC 102076 TaxID=1219078 RepID=A0A4Y3IQ27_9VIBR|nr:hypothetical protein [Vibrio comitans]GEA61185.1 hypothetical protein VCO01S_23780 [Vibrio comitans NBRC 102076]
MNNEKKMLPWQDSNIPHRLWLEPKGASTTIKMQIIKDVEPELLSLDLSIDYQTLLKHWKGEALAISPAHNEGSLFTQSRVLFNLPLGCIVWAVTHIMMPNGEKMSADKLAFAPQLQARDQQLQPI